MAPRDESKNVVSIQEAMPLFEGDLDKKLKEEVSVDAINRPYKMEIVWRNVIIMTFVHAGGLYGLYLLFTQAKWQTWFSTYIWYAMSGIGITAGAHRLWAHKSYKAKFPLQMLLVFMNCAAMQDDVIQWSRDHRVHHKWTETDADPYNAMRGFFFCHVGWLLCKKHPAVKEMGAKIDMSDLANDPLLAFQRKFYKPLALLCCFVIPTMVPCLFWGESLWVSYFTMGLFRYALTLNMTWTVNSLAHMYGSKPYDKHIEPTQNLTCMIGAFGEGWHNYHHSFPWDYRASEYAWKINATTPFIDFFTWVGWAYDRKIASRDMIQRKRARTGQDPATVKLKYVYG